MSGNTREIPDIAWSYVGLVQFMVTQADKQEPLYGLDDKRAKLHEELCEYYKITREQSLPITDNMDDYHNAAELHLALKALSEG